MSEENEGCYNLSYPVQGLLQGLEITCHWEIWAPEGFRVYVEILYLSIGFPAPTFLEFSADGSRLPYLFDEFLDPLDVVAPESHLNISFVNLGNPQAGFLLKLSITNEAGRTLFPNQCLISLIKKEKTNKKQNRKKKQKQKHNGLCPNEAFSPSVSNKNVLGYDIIVKHATCVSYVGF